MNPARWETVKSIFAEALERDEAGRGAWLDGRCDGDAELRRDVDRLLSAHRHPTERADGLEPVGAGPFLRASDRIGSYRVLRVLGEGGMGIVYLAEQDRPRRTVALKVIRPGVATPAMLRRFEHEAQVLGRLRHSGIAQIFQAGTANTGQGPQPYFAMELVRGRTLVHYAVESRLGTRDRLDLFARVCDAVQHAHEKGVIHRDLKPGNILVEDDRGGSAPQPKVLDFGVARATDADVQVSSVRTDMGQLLGTVPYMSPEQAAGQMDDIDARSDVYSLGVVLYELLTEQLPYDLTGRLVHEAVRVIREEEPRRLSALSAMFRGDIETIVSKALLKERARRYQSAAEMAADIRRYLASEPIKARPPTAAYQIARFARQHRAHEAAEAMAINKFLQELLATAESIFESGKANTVQGILDQAAARLEGGSLRDRPELEAELRTSMGLAYRALGLLEQSENQLRSAVAIRAAQLGDNHPAVATGEAVLGEVLSQRGRYDEAEEILRRSIDATAHALGDSHPDVGQSLCALAEVLHGRGRMDEAERMYRDALGAITPGSGRAATAAAMLGLSACLVEQGRIDEAEPVVRQCLELQSAFMPEGHWQLVAARSVLGACLGKRGRHEEAEALLLRAWGDLKSDPGAPSIVRRRAAERIAALYEATGRAPEALQWRKQAVAGGA